MLKKWIISSMPSRPSMAVIPMFGFAALIAAAINIASADDCDYTFAKNVPCLTGEQKLCDFCAGVDCTKGLCGNKPYTIYAGQFKCESTQAKTTCVPDTDEKQRVKMGDCADYYGCEWDAAIGKCVQAKLVSTSKAPLFKTVACQ